MEPARPKRSPLPPTPGGPKTTLRVRIGQWGLAGVVFIAGGLALYIWDDWFVNPDGGFYLGLARNLRHGFSYTFPDGSFAAFRGPVYPITISSAWLVLPETAKVAIWVTRTLVVVNGWMVAQMVLRRSRCLGAAVIAGLAGVFQPLFFVSGAFHFVPDLLATTFVLMALYIILPIQGSAAPSRLLFSGVLMGLAFLTKETYLLGLLVMLGIHMVHRGLGGLVRYLSGIALGWLGVVGPWMILAAMLADAGSQPTRSFAPAWAVAVVALVGLLALVGVQRSDSGGERNPTGFGLAVAGVVSFTGAFLALLAFAGAPIVNISEVLPALGQRVRSGLYRGFSGWWGLLAVLPALIWAWTSRSREVTAAVLLGAVGGALLLYSSIAGIGLRNGVMVGYSVALLVGSWVAYLFRSKSRIAVPGSLAVAVVFLVANIAAINGAMERNDASGWTWENPVTEAAAEWLEDRGEPVVGTPVFMSVIWRLTDANVQTSLAPLYVAPRTRSVGMDTKYDIRVWWAGSIREASPNGEQPVGLVVGGRQTGAYFVSRLDSALRDADADLLVVTGNLAALGSSWDGGTLLPYLESSDAASVVFRSSITDLPHWVVVYEIEGLLAPPDQTFVHNSVGAALNLEGAVVVGRAGYAEMIRSVLSRSPDGS